MFKFRFIFIVCTLYARYVFLIEMVKLYTYILKTFLKHWYMSAGSIGYFALLEKSRMATIPF